mmetsp:Transcript_796/g.1742  ORF Transcript_796/g.1742 Transcript_796/m.1742 type:complete len:109 (+) Transcript_796:333-659(+)
MGVHLSTLHLLTLPLLRDILLLHGEVHLCAAFQTRQPEWGKEVVYMCAPRELVRSSPKKTFVPMAKATIHRTNMGVGIITVRHRKLVIFATKARGDSIVLLFAHYRRT